MAHKRTFFWTAFLSSLLGAVLGIVGYGFFLVPTEPEGPLVAASASRATYYPSYAIDTIQTVLPKGINFVYAARSSVPSVVHVRVYKAQLQSPFMSFFSRDEEESDTPATGAGSGVIISSDGYVATNYHVVEDAKKIEVILSDNRSFVAEVVGTDPSTDLALLRIETDGLPAVPMGDSDELEVGTWVLAVGNPFELRSTVTAGIVSAKGRNIGSINNISNNLGIESFIQTDAVVNRGNSGGALVNLRGELVGINTAIYTETGGYDGYSFAVPSKLVQKVMEDLRKYGQVQRALLGIEIRNVDAQLAKEKGLSLTRGVFVTKISAGSAAEAAGLQEEDVITAVDGEEVLTAPQLQEKIARRRPGERVTISILRHSKAQNIAVTLKGVPKSFTSTPSTPTEETPDRTEPYSLLRQQLIFSTLTESEKERYAITYGVKLLAMRKRNWRYSGLRPGFVLMKINGRILREPEEAYQILSLLEEDDKVVIEGVYPNGAEASYNLLW